MRGPLTGVCSSFGCLWPANEEDTWLARMVRIRAQQLNKPEGVELASWMQATAVDLSHLLKRVSLPASWKREALKEEVLCRFDERTYPLSPSSYEHLKQAFWGDYLTMEACTQPFNEWEELLGLFARTVVAAELKLGV